MSRSSASSYPSSAATASWSSRPSRSRPRPVTTWTASRTSSSSSWARSTPPCGRSASQASASARSTVMSRRPPCDSLSSGSMRLGEVPLALVPGRHGLHELRQALAGVAAPVVRDGGPRGGDELGVAGERREVEQADGRGEVGGGDLPALGDGADAVVQAHPGVPDGVPDPVGQRGELLGREGALGVEEHEVVVAERAGVARGPGCPRPPGPRPRRGSHRSRTATPRRATRG